MCVALLVSAAPASANTAMQDYVEAMQPGWNLGNTLDASPNETAWGNAPTTQEMIQQVAAQGYKSIRIPVTWDTGGRVGPAPSYTIDPAWLDRVEQIVNWSLDSGLYVMLNMHHDSFWVNAMSTDHDAVLAKFNAIWSQIAPRFRDHSNKLHFESINEPTFTGADAATKNALLKELNVSFFNIVRGTGGGNATRPLVLPTVETNNAQEFLDSLSETIAELNDPNLIATVHEYGLWNFAVNITGVTEFEGAAENWTTAGIDRVYDTLVSNGIPVIVGEIGLLNWGGFNGAIERGESLHFFEHTMSYYRSKGMTYQWWDAGNFFNRSTFQWNLPEVYAYMMHSVVGRSSTAETDLIFVKTGAPVDTAISLNLNGNSFVSLTDGATTLIPGVDYVIDGSVLTIKADTLAQYASGGYGVKAVLSANFSDGVPWEFRVRHQATSVLSAKIGNKSDGLVIPASFNGDLVATMEGRYVGKGSPFPGPATWTPFQEHTTTYVPNHASNTITLKKAFFTGTTNNPIDLTFHMWSGRTLNYRLTFQPGGGIVTDPQQLVIYDDALASGWNDGGSWASHSFAEATTVHDGTHAMSITAGAWGGLILTHGGAAVDTSDYKTLVFWIHGGTTGGQSFGVGLNRGTDDTSPRVAIPAPQANTWRKVEIPLSSLGVEGSANITGVFFQNWTGADAATLYLDDIHLTTAYASDLVFVHGTPAPVISSPTAVSIARSATLSYTVAAVNDPVSFSVSGLPAWLTFDSASRTIAGTTAVPGTYRFTVTATNTAGTTSEEIVVRVEPTPVTISFPESSGPGEPRIEVAYDGASHAVSTTTQPGGIAVKISYDGVSTPPSLPGTYRVVASSDDPNFGGDAEATLVITSGNPGRLVNLSIRAVAGADASTLIVGFVASGGSGDASVLIRGVGPTLSDLGVTGTLLGDPRLTLFDTSHAVLTDDDWDRSLEPLFVRAGAFPLPIGSADAAVAAALPHGAYTAHISGAGGGTGIALGEIYDLAESYSSATPVLVNASARCQVGSGSEVLIPGFVIGGTTPLRVLIRAVGPTLEGLGVSGVLADPRLTLFRGAEAIGSNDDWEAGIAATFVKAGAFPLPIGSKDAAMIVELAPGGYTAHVQGADGSMGVALVELYALPGL